MNLSKTGISPKRQGAEEEKPEIQKKINNLS